MRALLLVLAAGCGRFEFSHQPDRDAAIDTTSDAASDAAIDVGPGGLVARYAMDDDPQGGVVGSAELPGGCTTCPMPTGGRIGGAYLFDGSTTFFTVPSSTLVGASPYTVTVWVRVDIAPQGGLGRSIANKPIGPSSQYNAMNLLLLDGPAPALETTETGIVAAYTTAATFIPVGEWHHIAASWTGADKAVYVDGVLAKLDTGVIASDSIETIRVGADLDYGAPMFHFAGALDELRFYGRALDAAEIAGLAAP